MTKITQQELETFQSVPFNKKVDAMEAYLIGIPGYSRANMGDVGRYVFGNSNYSFTVSLIHRCYNFSGQNAAKYRNGCAFERNYNYRVSRNDIESFIRTYPNGTYNSDITFEQFLIWQVQNNRNNQYNNTSQQYTRPSTTQNNSQYNNSYNTSQQYTRPSTTQNNSQYNNSYNTSQPSTTQNNNPNTYYRSNNNKYSSQSGEGCYIATCVYGSYDCPNVWILRRYRDNHLAKTFFGRMFIKIYYTISPKLVRIFGDTAWFKSMCKKPLDKMVARLIDKGFEDTPYSDKK